MNIMNIYILGYNLLHTSASYIRYVCYLGYVYIVSYVYIEEKPLRLCYNITSNALPQYLWQGIHSNKTLQDNL